MEEAHQHPVEGDETPLLLPVQDSRMDIHERMSVLGRIVQTPTSKTPPSVPGAALLVLLLATGAILPLLFFPPPHLQSAPATSLGTLTMTSSGQFNAAMTQGYNDIITLSLHSIPAPPAGALYAAWLMPDQGDETTAPLLIGTFRAGGDIYLSYTSPDHRNLLALYSGVRISVTSNARIAETAGQDSTAGKWEAFIPNIAPPGDENHYSLLSHLRHLLASDPTLQANQIPGGLVLWLTRNISKVEEWASAAQGDWHGLQTSEGDGDQLHRHMLRILAYLDGQFYYTWDVPAGSPWLVDPVSGKIGLLTRVENQKPPSLLSHVDIHLTGLATSPGHTQQQQQLAILVDQAINRVQKDLQHVRNEAAILATMNLQQIRQQSAQILLNDLASLTTEVQSGWFDPNTGETIGGAFWIASLLQHLATLSIGS